MNRRELTTIVITSLLSAVTGGLVVLEWGAPSVVAAQDVSPPIISALKFEVQDLQGKVRAELNGQGIVFFGPNHERRIEVTAEPIAGIHLLDAREQTRAQLFVAPDGRVQLFMHDIAGRVRSVLNPDELAFVHPEGTPVLHLTPDPARGSRLRVSSTGPLPAGIQLIDRKGTPRVTLESEPEIQPPDSLTEEGAQGCVTVFDRSGTIVWQAPQ